MLSEAHANGCLYGKFSDDVAENKEMMQRIAQRNPLYFNINAGFNSDEASEQLRRFLHDSFPTPIYLERTAATGAASLMAAASGGDEANASATAAASAAADASLTPLFDALMQLPVVGVVSYEEGACPLVRSLSLAFAGHHRGRVHVVVQRPGGGDASETLREARTRLKHRVFSATPVPRCAYGPQVTAGPVWRCR
ncbi:hypothetical protein ABL78_8224 [Leptomonas seymouri]|uniref:Uncharacterized protein n=1 Tax=Leptomonas seymouri TaxID=5684 RepID=A0A0N0P2B7_LEPSE|nr:hypothetical protein ABL78_8224 [Leptomonas seymouri]|eukprot:KPI82766.1 hypothetical protein ABL78_8224 [Leptomonas seymouri]